MTAPVPPTLVALAAAAGVDPAIFADPTVATYFDDIAQAVAMLGEAPPADPDAASPFDPAWPDYRTHDGGSS